MMPRRGWSTFPLAPGVARLAWATQILGDPDGYLIVARRGGRHAALPQEPDEFPDPASHLCRVQRGQPGAAFAQHLLPGAGTQAPYITRTHHLAHRQRSAEHVQQPRLDDRRHQWRAWAYRRQQRRGRHGSRWRRTAWMRRFQGPVASSTSPTTPTTDEPATARATGTVRSRTCSTGRTCFTTACTCLASPKRRATSSTTTSVAAACGNDRVSAEGQDSSGTEQREFLDTRRTAAAAACRCFVFPGPTPDRSSGLDQEVMLHELTHGMSNRLHNNATGLNTNMAPGMGEGWSDFYARALLSTADEDVNGVYATGGWVTHALAPGYTNNYYYGIRRFPHAVRTSVGPNGKPHNPLTFADIDPTQINLTDGAFPRGPFGGSGAARSTTWARSGRARSSRCAPASSPGLASPSATSASSSSSPTG